MDSRRDYYAELALAKGIDPLAIDRRLREVDDSYDSELKTRAANETLGGMASRGDGGAMTCLREQVATGHWWTGRALDTLISAGKPEAWEGLDEVIARRFPNLDELDDQLWYQPLDEEPWRTWKATGHALSPMLRTRGRRLGKRAPRFDATGLTTEELLDIAERGPSTTHVWDGLRSRDSAADYATLLAAIDLNRPWRATAALHALASKSDPRVLAPAQRVIEGWRGGWTGGRMWGHSFQLLRWASRALARLRPELVLPLARAWRSSTAWKYRVTAHAILEKHATSEDVPWLRRRLSRPITDGRVYSVCDIAELLERFPQHGPYSALRRVYHEFPYSFGRQYIVRAMAATDPAFPSGLAMECLWDSERSVREVAASSVNTSTEAARARLAALAEDPYEEDEVRAAAAARI